MTEILHKVQLDDGSVANTVASTAVIAEMYPLYAEGPIDGYVGAAVTDYSGATMQPVNSALRFKLLPDGKTAILGNTVTRLCPIAKDCGSCALTGAGLSVAEMSERNCARANTARAFEMINQDPRGRFILTATSRDAYVLDSDALADEYAGVDGDVLMQRRMRPANSVVITESWLRSQELESFTVGMNGADGSMGVFSAVIDDIACQETLYIPFCSMRTNMGDRSEKDQILRQALNAYFDAQGFDEATRSRIMRNLQPAITLAASASLRYFAHKISVPEEESENERERMEAQRLRDQYPDLYRRAGNKITSAIVLNDQYPGAMERGSIFPQFEAEIGIRETPITPDNCPGDGQTCHIDYRSETEYALRKQLLEMGVIAGNIHYDESHALDPASPGNNMATNRREQNEGVAVANTNRTINAMRVELPRVRSYVYGVPVELGTPGVGN